MLARRRGDLKHRSDTVAPYIGFKSIVAGVKSSLTFARRLA